MSGSRSCRPGRALYHERIGWLNSHKKEVAVYENPCYNFLIQYIILKYSIRQSAFWRRCRFISCESAGKFKKNVCSKKIGMEEQRDENAVSLRLVPKNGVQEMGEYECRLADTGS